MNIAQIKAEITQKLRRVREDSKEFSDTQNYDELQRIITKSIVALADCDTVADIENFELYLESIEFYYNSCLEESTGEPSQKELFDFDFELEEEDECEAKNIPDRKIDSSLNAAIDEIESYYHLTLPRCRTFFQKRSLKALRKSAVDSVQQASAEPDFINAQRAFRTEIKQFTSNLDKSDAYAQAKKQYDEKSVEKSNKKFNAFRMILAFVGLIGGAVYGFFLDWTKIPEWPIAIMCFGLSCLLLCIVYVMADGKKEAKTKRRLAFARLILSGLFLVLSIIVGIVFKKYIGILPALFATSPFTLGGIVAYLIYRLKLELAARKILGKNQ